MYLLHLPVLLKTYCIIYALPWIPLWQDLGYSLFLRPHPFFKKINKSVKYFIPGRPHMSVVWKRWSRRAWGWRGQATHNEENKPDHTVTWQKGSSFFVGKGKRLGLCDDRANDLNWQGTSFKYWLNSQTFCSGI